MNKGKVIKFGILVFIIAIAGAFLFSYISQYSHRSKAAEEISVSFGNTDPVNPRVGSFTIPVTISHASNKLSAANLYFYYNNENISLIDFNTVPVTTEIMQLTASTGTPDSYDTKDRIVFVSKKKTDQLTKSFIVNLSFVAHKSGQTKIAFKGETGGVVGPAASGIGVVTYTGDKLPTLVEKTITISTSVGGSSSSTGAEACGSLANGDRSTTQCVIRGGICKVDPGEVMCSKCLDGYDELSGAQNLGCASGELCCLRQQGSSSSINPPSTSSSSSPPASSSSSTGLCLKKSQGDANCDDVIDPLDYSIWLNHQCIPEPGQTCSDVRADFNGDHQVDDTTDYPIWDNHKVLF